MSDDLKTEVAEVESLEPAVETTATLDEEDIAAQEALEKELAELDGIEKSVVETIPAATTVDTTETVDEVDTTDVDLTKIFEDIQQYFEPEATETKAEVKPATTTTTATTEPTVDTTDNTNASAAELKLRELEHQMALVRQVLIKEHEEKQRMAKEQEMFGKLQNLMNQSLVIARKEHPDYDDAAQFFIESRAAYYKALSDVYPNSETQEGAMQYVHNELGQLIASCAKNKTNPAKKLYNIAKSLGYKAADQSPKKSVAKADMSNIQRVNFAQKATKTLASTTGVNDVESDVPMSDEEYDEWIQNPENQALIKKRMQMVSY